MKSPEDQPPHDAAELHRQAEAAFARAAAAAPEDPAALTPAAMRALLHELRVHQIELEMQNEELRQTQLALDALRATYFDLYDLAPVGYCTLSETGVIIEANLTLANLLGVARRRLGTQPFSRLILRDDQDDFYRLRMQLLGAQPAEAEPDDPPPEHADSVCELRMIRSDGSLFWAQLVASVVPGPNRSADLDPARERRQNVRPALRIVVTDINARKQTEAVQVFLAQAGSRTANEPFFHLLARFLAQTLEANFVCIDRLEGDGLNARTLAVWSDGHFEDNVTYALKDTPCGDVVGKTVCCFPADVCRFFPRDQVLRDLCAESYIGATLWSHTGQPIGLIAVIGRKPLANRVRAQATLELVGGRASGELERLNAEAALRESEDNFSAAVEYAPVGVAMVSPDGHWLRANRVLCDLVGYAQTDLLKLTFRDITEPEDLALELKHMDRLLAGEIPDFRIEKRYRHKLGHSVAALLRVSLVRDAIGAPRFFVSHIQDLTAIRELEDKYRQAQKMESIGVLAGGIAHDFNNILTVIEGYSELILAELSPGNPVRPYVNSVKAAGEHAARLTAQLLAFSRKQVLRPTVLNLNSLITRVEAMLRRLIPESVELHVVLDPDLGSIEADPGQIEQLVMNLAVNAGDAMPGGGTLTLATADVCLGEDREYQSMPVSAGRYVRLTVTDTGLGMDSETQLRAFEPFFSTKVPGRGTGLGLATVYGVVRDLGGDIGIHSRPEHGSTFTIHLPTTAKEAARPAVTGDQASCRPGTETILLVEDEPVVRELVATILTGNGFAVLEAANGAEALSVCDGHGGPIHLLLTDVVMPKMGGVDLKARIVERHQGIKVLFMSGYAQDLRLHHGMADAEFIGKPFEPDDLLRKVRAILDR